MKRIVLILLILTNLVGLLGAQSLCKEVVTYDYFERGDSVISSKQYECWEGKALKTKDNLVKFRKIKDRDSVIYTSVNEYNLGQRTLVKKVLNAEAPANNSKEIITFYNLDLGKGEAKMLLKKRFNSDLELVGEDTFSYNAKGDLIQKMAYSYLGSTSLYVDRYVYDKNGGLKKWFQESRWLTMNIKGNHIEKTTLRKKMVYKNNDKGQRLKGRGFSWDDKVKEYHEYHPNGILRRSVTKTLLSCKRKREAKKKKSTLSDVIEVFTYNTAGKELSHQVYRGDSLYTSDIKEYQNDTTITRELKYAGKLLQSEVVKNYHPNNKLKTNNYRYFIGFAVVDDFITEFDEQGNMVSEKKYYRGKSISNVTFQIEYNSKKQILKKIEQVRNNETKTNVYKYNRNGQIESESVYLNDKLHKASFCTYK
jgi:hypothetical protein